MSAYRKIKNYLKNNDNKFISILYRKSSNFKRTRKNHRQQKIIKKGNASFVTINELTEWTLDWIKTFSHDYDVVIGIPRSGMLVANIIASKTAKPLSTPDLFMSGQIWKSKRISDKPAYNNILLVDDSINTGKSMQFVVDRLRSYSKNINIYKSALIVNDRTRAMLDYYYKVIPAPRMFEWDCMHQKKVDIIAFDMDGVLCENCPDGVDRDEMEYSRWVKNAKVYLIPSYEIDYIVSNRLERYRGDTEKWLAMHGVQYKELILWDTPAKEDRDSFALNKIRMLNEIRPTIFFESSYSQSEKIWKSLKIPTLCIDEMVLFGR